VTARRAGPIGVRVLLGALTLLGSYWLASRWAPRAAPRWSDADFVRLRSAWPGPRAGELWVLPVNPSCPHCTSSLAAFRRRSAGQEANRLVVLIVDAPRRPEASAVERLGSGVEVWWDARSIWRDRWGYRVYGEPIRFDASGAYRGALGLAPARGRGGAS